MKQELCAYCGNPATTRDHVPPQSLFNPPLPNNLITVPACDQCNNGVSDDDEVFRNELSFMAGSFGESPKAAQRLQPTMRGIRRNKAMLTRMVKSAQRVERYTQSGLYLGHGFAVPLMPGVQQRVITRIVRGLYWHHVGARLDADTQITLVFIDKRRAHWREGLYTLRKLAPAHRLIGDGETFQYFYGQANDDPAFSVWLLIFFKGMGEQIILAHTAPRAASGTIEQHSR
jgi:hypothetical protein